VITSTRARLFSGLWLFGYAVTHLINHALGLVSLAAAESGRAVFVAFWRFPPVEATLLAARLLHTGLGVWSLWQRRSLRMGATDALQITMGLLIPTYLTAHVMGTGWLHRCCGVTDGYSFILGRVWQHGIGSLTVMLLLVWLHGTIGLHCWARLYPVYRRLQPWLLMVATLIPVLALAGVISGGRELAARRSTDAAAWAMLAVQQNWPSDAQRAAWGDGPAQ
jgi:adenylate cyclase